MPKSVWPALYSLVPSSSVPSSLSLVLDDPLYQILTSYGNGYQRKVCDGVEGWWWFMSVLGFSYKQSEQVEEL